MRSKTVDRLLKSTPKEVALFVDWYADLVVRINQILREKNLSKKELAELMDKQPSEISKWLGAEHNFTLRSLAKLSAELGEPLIEIKKKPLPIEYVEDGFVCRVHTFVSYTKIDTAVPNKTYKTTDTFKSTHILNHAS
jgi:transcriptional regulator with XRE-family HTH domain